MKSTITVLLENRFNDAERVIGMFSSTGYKIEKMMLSDGLPEGASRLTVVTAAGDRPLRNLLIRLEQQIRVSSVACEEGDHLNNAVDPLNQGERS